MQETPIDISKLSPEQQALLSKQLAEAGSGTSSEKPRSQESIIAEAGRKSENKLPDSGGSHVSGTVSEGEMIAATDERIIDPAILNPDKKNGNKVLQKKLEDFLDDPHKAMKELMEQNPN